MLVVGIILLLAGLLLGGYVVAGGLPDQPGTDVSLSLLGLTVETSAVVVFAMGALTLLLLELGVLALHNGARKSSRRRAELQRLRRVEAEVQARQSAESQRNAATAAGVPAAPAPFARRETGPIPTRPEPTTSDQHRDEQADARDRTDRPPAEASREADSTTGTDRTDRTDEADGGSTRSERG